MNTASPTQSVCLTQMKVVHVVAFDVSGSMQAPLKLRSNAQDANKGSGELDPKRVQTVFDVICRLAEDGIAAAKDQDMYAAVLCFGLRHVSTCDLLALLEERTKVLELLDVAELQSTSRLPRHQARALLAAHGISFTDADKYLIKVPGPSDHSSASSEELYTVVGYQPLVALLAMAGAPYCEKYVNRHTTPKSAGKYFMAFATPNRANDLRILVDRLPNACKNWWDVAGFVMDGTHAICAAVDTVVPAQMAVAGNMAAAVEKDAASEAIRFADSFIAGGDKQDSSKRDVLAFLRSIPTATPRPLSTVVQLIKRLQSALKPNKDQDSAMDKVQPTPEDSQSTIINWERMLDDIDPYLYGGTPMCEALQSVRPIFQDQRYSSKVMILISDGAATDGDPLPPAQVLRNAGGTIFACLLTDSVIEEPRRLRGLTEVDRSWPKAARDMFEMASTASYDSGPVQVLRRRGWKLPASGQCKLFVQANNPIIIDEFTTASRSLGTSSDALADMVGEISLDVYIRKSNDGAEVTDQGARAICWAHASASVIHLASHRVVGRKVEDFFDIRSHLLKVFKENNYGQNVGTVLTKICPSYKLCHQICDEAGARAAIHARRPVVATFALDDNRWKRFSAFYKSRPKDTLMAKDMSAPAGGKMGGHAVVLVRCDETSLTFMNSWGPGFANNGFFTVDKASTLEIAGQSRMQFYDVYWTIEDLSNEEKTKWKEHEAKTVSNVIGVLPKSFHDLPVDCPHCKKTAPARNYDGSWNKAQCRACKGVFTPTVQALVRSLYESNYDTV